MRSPRIATILVLASCAALAACERERAPTANDAQVATAPAQAVVELQQLRTHWLDEPLENPA